MAEYEQFLDRILRAVWAEAADQGVFTEGVMIVSPLVYKDIEKYLKVPKGNIYGHQVRCDCNKTGFQIEIVSDGNSMANIYGALVMSRSRASQVRQWRVDDNRTWREISQLAGDSWEESLLENNQLIGIELCKAAARFFGEMWDRKPWN